MRTSSTKHILLVLLAICLAFSSWAQGPDKEVLENANALFEEGNFAEAKPMYESFLSNYQSDAFYNYRYGACKLFTESDKNDPLRYLEFAISKEGVDPEAFFYLGRAYHLNYRFDDAVNAFNRFKTKANEKQLEKLDVERQIEMCRNGNKLILNLTDILVLEKTELNEKVFAKTYDLKEFGGTILTKPDEFLSSQDKKEGDPSVMYFNKNAPIVYFSSYGEKGKTGKDIYYKERLDDGEFGPSRLLVGPVNTPYDEDYPFMHPDGKTLYFASQGHNSMGGFDIFRAEYDATTKSWGSPENLDFAINTPDDDFLMITNLTEDTAYFSSAREAPKGRLTIYRVVLERIPLSVSIISGTFQGLESNFASITVVDAQNQRQVDIVDTDPESGHYTLNLRNGGKYNFFVAAEGSELTHEGVVDLPRIDKLQQFEQKMRVYLEGEEEKLEILNLFDGKEVGVEKSPELMADLLKQKAKLEVTPEGEIAPPPPKEVEGPSVEILEEEGGDDVSTQAIVKEAHEEAASLSEEAMALANMATVAFGLVDQKSKQAEEASEEAQSLLDANETLDEATKEKIQALNKKAANKAGEASVALEVAYELEAQASKKANEAATAEKYATDIENAAETPDTQDSIDKLSRLKEFLEEQGTEESSTTTELAIDLLEKKRKFKEKAVSAKNKFLTQLVTEESELKEDQTSIQGRIETEKDGAIKEELQRELAEIERGITTNTSQQEQAQEDIESFERELELLSKQDAIVGTLVSSIESGDPNEVALSKEERAALSERLNKLEEAEDAIEDAQKAKEERADAAMVADETAESDEAEEPLIVIDTGGEPIHDESTGFVRPPISDSDLKLLDKNYEAFYEKRLGQTDELIDPANKEVFRQEVLDQWDTQLDDELQEVRLELADARGQKKIDEYAGQISVLEEKKEELAIRKGESITKMAEVEEEKAAQAEMAQAEEEEAEDVPSTDPIVDEEEAPEVVHEIPTETTDPQEVPKEESYSTAEKVFETEAASYSQMEDGPEKAKKIIELNGKWVGEIDNEITNLQDSVELIESEGEKLVLEEKIGALRALREEKIEASQAQENVVEELALNANLQEAQAGNDPIEEETPEIAQPDLPIEETPTPEVVEEDPEEVVEEPITEPDPVGEESVKPPVAKTQVEPPVERTAANDALDETSKVYEETKETFFEDILAIGPARDYDEAYFQNQVTEISKMEDDYLRLIELTRNTKEWKASLDEEIVKVKAKRNRTPDPDERRLLGREVNRMGAVSRQKEQEVNLSLGVIESMAIAKGDLALPALDNETISAFKDANTGEESDQQLAEKTEEVIPNTAEEVSNEIQPVTEEESQPDAVVEAQEEEETTTQATPAVVGDDANPTTEAEVIEQRDRRSPTTKPASIDLSDLNNQEPYEPELYQEALQAQEVALAEANTLEEELSAAKTELEETKKKSERIEVEKRIKALETQVNLKQQEAALQEYRAESIDRAAKAILELEPGGKRASEMQTELAQQQREEHTGILEEASQIRDLVEETKSKKEKAKLVDRAATLEEDGLLLEQAVLASESLAGEMAQVEREALASQYVILPEDKVSLPDFTKTLSPEEAEKVQATQEYKDYSEKQDRVAKMKKFAGNLFKNSATLRAEGAASRDRSKRLLDQAPTIANEADREASLKEAEKQIRISEISFAMADSSDAVAKKLLMKADFVDNESKRDLVSINNPVLTEQIIAFKNGDGQTTPQPVAITETVIPAETPETLPTENEDLAENEQDPPTAINRQDPPPRINTVRSPPLAQPIFSRTEREVSVYTESKPIPINENPLEGLVFKVQVGAYSKPIPQDVFKGFSPISGENTSLPGVTRYTAGLFKSVAEATSAQTEIRGFGYDDAFVVAYVNGRRISLAEARAIQRGESAIADFPRAQPSPVVRNPVNTGGQNVSREDIVSSGQTVIEEASKINGLFYTVQVGVYSKPVRAEDIFNISPLVSERTQSGFVRYTSGVYKNVPIATTAKDQIVEIGVKDAFVTAIYNGARITVAESRRLLSQNGPSILTNSSMARGSAPTVSAGGPPANTANQDNGVRFAIVIGTYKTEVPVGDAKVILEYSGQNMKVNKSPDGSVTTYTTGNFTTFNAAENQLQEIVNKGVSGARIVATQNGSAIQLESARQLSP